MSAMLAVCFVSGYFSTSRTSEMETSSSILNFLECLSNESQSSSSGSILLKPDKKATNKKTSITTSEEGLSQLETHEINESVETTLYEDNNEVILSVYWKRGKLGAASFICSRSELQYLNDIVDVQPDFKNLKTLINQIQPSQVLTCGGLPDVFVKSLSDAINPTLESEEDTESESGHSRKIFFMSSKSKDLGYDSCKRSVLGLKLGFEPNFSNEEDHILYISTYIDLAQESMIISLGMLIKYLNKYLTNLNLSRSKIEIMLLTQISLENLVLIDENTYKALQIFNARVHPSAFKRNVSGSSREGLSLFGILNRCKSKAGLKKMRHIFLNPSKNIEELNERLDAVEFCCRPRHQHIVANIMDCIKKVENVTVKTLKLTSKGVLANIYRTRANVSHWRSLYTSLYNAILIGEICKRHDNNSKLLEKVGNSITKNVHEVAQYMNRVIDFEKSIKNDHFTVRDGIDNKLDLLNQTYSQIPEVLIKVAKIELDDLPTFIEQCCIIYITELGYLLSVPVWRGDGTNPSDYTLPNFTVKFVVNNYVYYKTPRCLELDNVLGDTVSAISNIESKIMIALIEFIHARSSDILKAADMIAELDCVIAFASVACENNYRRPFLTNEKKLEIIQGRHPLQELCVDNFVPNDTYFGTNTKLIKILTGPNASGKSVYLKQVGLIAFLAHIGSFVPAQKAVIGILDSILSRVQSVESISMRMSAFLIDLKQMSLAFYNSTPQSLIIIDEFGKGTSEIDGLSLFAASLIHFIERKDSCPYVLASTHFHRLPQLLPKTPLIHLQFMNYLIENEEIVYLHKITDGSSGSSLTLSAAKAAGLTEDAAKRSLEILEGTKTIKPNPKLKITKSMMQDIMYTKKILEMV